MCKYNLSVYSRDTCVHGIWERDLHHCLWVYVGFNVSLFVEPIPNQLSARDELILFANARYHAKSVARSLLIIL